MDVVEILEESKQNNENSDIIGSDFIHTRGKIAIPYLVMICLATLFGSVGNVFIIGAVFADRSLRSIGNVFIVNLAVADLCVSSFVNPFSMVGIIEGEMWFIRHDAVCQAVASICLTSCFCSLLSIGTISFNRYIHICHNALYDKIFTVKTSLGMVVLLWVVSFTLEMPNFFGWGDHTYDRKTLNCIWDRQADLSYSLFFSLVGVAFPVCLISFCYYKIYRYVILSKKKVAVNRSNTQGKGSDMSHSKRLARTLFVIFVIFTLCWAPYAVFVSADYKDQLPLEIHIFATLVAHTNSSLNFLIYGVTNRDFRKGYIKFIRRTRGGVFIFDMIQRCCRCFKGTKTETGITQKTTISVRKENITKSARTTKNNE